MKIRDISLILSGVFLSVVCMNLWRHLARTVMTNATNYADTYSMAFVTTPNMDVAKKIARLAVEKKLAACVNIIPQVTSIYEWQGKIEEDNEQLLMLKTRTEVVPELTQFVRENHPNDVCEVISSKIDGGNSQYLEWIGQVVPGSTKQPPGHTGST